MRLLLRFLTPQLNAEDLTAEYPEEFRTNCFQTPVIRLRELLNAIDERLDLDPAHGDRYSDTEAAYRRALAQMRVALDSIARGRS